MQDKRISLLILSRRSRMAGGCFPRLNVMGVTLHFVGTMKGCFDERSICVLRFVFVLCSEKSAAIEAKNASMKAK
jgi:hypothetical protein